MYFNLMQYNISDIHSKKLRNSEVNLRERGHTVHCIAVLLDAGVKHAAREGPPGHHSDNDTHRSLYLHGRPPGDCVSSEGRWGGGAALPTFELIFAWLPTYVLLFFIHGLICGNSLSNKAQVLANGGHGRAHYSLN